MDWERARRPRLLRQVRKQAAWIVVLKTDLRTRTAALATANRSLIAAHRAIVRLTARVAWADARAATSSRNSSRPPSTDRSEHRPHPRSLRPRSTRHTGGQPGHVGHTVLARAPDRVVVHRPAVCTGCGVPLAGLVATRRVRRQVIDLPPIRPRVVEHQAETLVCPACGAETTAPFPAAVTAPVSYGPGVQSLAVYLHTGQLLPVHRTAAVLAEVCGCPIADGTVLRAVARSAGALAPTEAAIKGAVTRGPLVHLDETGLHLGPRTLWLHVASTDRLTFYAVHPQRGSAALEAIGLVPAFRGRAVHDGWTAYQRYTRCQHSLCNAHHLRELTFVAEELHQAWAAQLATVLRDGKAAVAAARFAGRAGLTEAEQAPLVARYTALLAIGALANPAPPPTGRRGHPTRGKAGSLVARLQQQQAATLAFLGDVRIPFDNNQAERDLRMMQLRQKISGGFRTRTGADQFCRLRGYLSTLRKQRLPVVVALRATARGTPPLPLFDTPATDT